MVLHRYSRIAKLGNTTIGQSTQRILSACCLWLGRSLFLFFTKGVKCRFQVIYIFQLPKLLYL